MFCVYVKNAPAASQSHETVTSENLLGETEGMVKEGDQIYKIEHCDELLVFEHPPSEQDQSSELEMIRLKTTCVVGLWHKFEAGCEEGFKRLLIV